MICPECGTDFCEKSVNQIYCSPKCGERYRKKHPMEARFPSVAFYCAKCGKAVVTDGKRDKRTRFCCQECERRYWRHPPTEHSALRTMPERLTEWYEKKGSD